MIGVVIQARMGSSRLPGKVLRLIGDEPMLGYILSRLIHLKHEVTIVVATSTLKQDDAIVDFCVNNGINCFRGDELNVLDRYYKCSLFYQFDHIIRLTADNPFLDIHEIDRLIDLHLQNGNEFTESFSMLPIGVGAEIFSFSALAKSMELSSLPHHFEHVDEYILENKEKFNTSTLTVSKDKNHPEVRLTVDTLLDYQKACFIVSKCKHLYITTEGAIRLCLHYV